MIGRQNLVVSELPGAGRGEVRTKIEIAFAACIAAALQAGANLG
jgi:hypothetical protein